jgi:AcrR family transcriptional regulator
MVSASGAVRAPQATRRKVLEAAFAEFYAHGFQGGSLNHIVEMAGTTKGALFHHFDGKQELGYAVVDEIIGPLLLERWLDPLENSTDPVPDLQAAFRRFVALDIQTGSWLNGCPMNNLAQEMSPLDDGFYERINRLYETWRERYAVFVARGVEMGTVKANTNPNNAAALIVAAQMGIWGSGKSSRNQDVMRQAAEGLCEYLESLRA